MTMQLKGKRALVTGGAKRVGKAIAMALAAQGADIVLHYNASEKEAEETAAEIRSLGGRCDLVQADLAESREVIHLIGHIEHKKLLPEILINSASLFFKTPPSSLNENVFDELISANLKAPYLLSVELAKRLAKKKGGKIVNIADWSAFRPYKSYLPYCTSKGGLVTMTKALARDFAPKVYANAIAPGPVLPPPDMSAREIDLVAKTTALGRWGTPEDIANAVRFVLENDFINGTVLVVDGGRSIV